MLFAWRKLIIDWAYRRKWRREQRVSRRLLAHLAQEKRQAAAEISSLKNQLSVERYRHRLREESMLDRLYHAVKLTGVSHSTVEIDKSYAAASMPNPSGNSNNQPPAPHLSPDQENLLLDFEENFFEEGRKVGKSDFDLEREWNSHKNDYIAEVRRQIN